MVHDFVFKLNWAWCVYLLLSHVLITLSFVIACFNYSIFFKDCKYTCDADGVANTTICDQTNGECICLNDLIVNPECNDCINGYPGFPDCFGNSIKLKVNCF